MPSVIDIDEPRIKAFGDLVRTLAPQLVDAWSPDVAVKVDEPRVVSDAALRADLLPETGTAFAVDLGGDSGGPCLLLLEAEPSDEILARREATEDALVAALSSSGAAVEKSGRHFALADSTWTDGEDPLPAGSYVAAELTLAGDELAKRGFVIAFAPAVMDALGSEAGDSPQPEGPIEGVVTLMFDETLSDRVASALGTEPRACRALHELVAAWREDDVRAAVVEIPAGREYLLATMRGLIELPEGSGKTLTLILGHPDAWTVSQCGRLALFSVLPADFEPGALLERVAPKPATRPG